MHMRKSRPSSRKGRNPMQVLYRTLDVITVVLLLSGQINISGVFFFKGGGISLSFAGPITGGLRSIPQQGEPEAVVGIDFISIVAALLLILDQVNIIGTLVTQSGLSIVLSGPILGEANRGAYSPEACEFIDAYTEHVQRTMQMN